MSSAREFSIQAMLSYFGERDHSENQAQESYNMSAGEILAVVIAALTLLVATIPLFRCSRFRRWVSSAISSFVKKSLSITPPNPGSIDISTLEDSSAIVAPEIPTLRPVFVYNDYSNARLVGICSDAFLYSQNGFVREDGGAPQADETLAPRTPEQAALSIFIRVGVLSDPRT
ncbi:hypothetical protein B9Z19DRAFT_1127909 [Tuber borchii]|uniref:Uncharacterized protein n=1 Tax=Tuber borchii TaxID=42251 RepID=A0A2T6ZQG9_TUBBO|nr:hypothetical protein B9Z19DRAFT_1127909 [Tuber borchii]